MHLSIDTMESIKRGINDVDFVELKRHGNRQFRSYIFWLMKNGSYHPTFDLRQKKEVEDIIHDYMAGFDPPARFLLVKKSKQKAETIVLMPKEQSTEKIHEALNRGWKNWEKWITSSEGKTFEKEHFSSLLSALAEDISHDDLAKIVTKYSNPELIRTIQEYMKFRFPNGVIHRLSRKSLFSTVKSRLSRELARLKQEAAKQNSREKSKNEWTRWKKAQSGDKTSDEKGQHSDDGNGEPPSTTAVEENNGETVVEEKEPSPDDAEQSTPSMNIERREEMEQRYPKGTKIEMMFKGEVVGYNPPNYLIRYGDQFQETFDEEDMKHYAILSDSPIGQATESVAVEPIEEEVEPMNSISMNNETAERFERMDLELARQKSEIDRLKKEFAEFRNENRTPSEKREQEEKQKNDTSAQTPIQSVVLDVPEDRTISEKREEDAPTQSIDVDVLGDQTANQSSFPQQPILKEEREQQNSDHSPKAVTPSPVQTGYRSSRVRVRRRLDISGRDVSATEEGIKKRRVQCVTIKQEF